MIKDFSKLKYDKIKQAKARKMVPFFTTSPTYSKSQELSFCNNCGDTAFHLLENNVDTKKCCRCGKIMKEVK